MPGETKVTLRDSVGNGLLMVVMIVSSVAFCGYQVLGIFQFDKDCRNELAVGDRNSKWSDVNGAVGSCVMRNLVYRVLNSLVYIAAFFVLLFLTITAFVYTAGGGSSQNGSDTPFFAAMISSIIKGSFFAFGNFIVVKNILLFLVVPFILIMFLKVLTITTYDFEYVKKVNRTDVQDVNSTFVLTMTILVTMCTLMNIVFIVWNSLMFEQGEINFSVSV